MTVKKGKKEALKHFKHVIIFCPNRGHFVRINQGILGRRYWKYQHCCNRKFRRLVCRATDEGKIKTYGSDTSVSFILITIKDVSLWYWVAFIVNQNWKKNSYKLGRVDYRIPILQQATSKSKKKPWHESRKMVLS